MVASTYEALQLFVEVDLRWFLVRSVEPVERSEPMRSTAVAVATHLIAIVAPAASVDFRTQRLNPRVRRS